MIGKSFEIHASQVALAYVVSFGRVGGLLEEGSQLAVKLVRELSSCDIFIVIHDVRDVRGDLRMKLKPHQPRRPWIWESNSGKEIALA